MRYSKLATLANICRKLNFLAKWFGFKSYKQLIQNDQNELNFLKKTSTFHK